MECNSSTCPTCCIEYFGSYYCGDPSSCVHQFPTYGTVLLCIALCLIYFGILFLFFCFRNRKLLEQSVVQGEIYPQPSIIPQPVMSTGSQIYEPSTNIRIIPTVYYT